MQRREVRREMAQRRGLLHDAESVQFVGPVSHVGHCFDDVIDMALGVRTSRNREADQIHCRRNFGAIRALSEHGVNAKRLDDGPRRFHGRTDLCKNLANVSSTPRLELNVQRA